jgi:hypothetical protein
MVRLSLLLASALLSACMPAIEYTLPDPMPIKGPLKSIGPFHVDTRGCGSYSTRSVDEKIIRPALRAKLGSMGALTADNVVVTEKWYDVPLGLLIIPAVFGCSNWTITGDALVLDRPHAP